MLSTWHLCTQPASRSIDVLVCKPRSLARLSCRSSYQSNTLTTDDAGDHVPGYISHARFPRPAVAGKKAAQNFANLAFLGDAVWTLYIRNKYLLPPKHVGAYRDLVGRHVRAEQQAVYYDQLLAGDSALQPEEKALLTLVMKEANNKMKWGPRTRHTEPASQSMYLKATALEALVGHLQLTDPQRLEAVMHEVYALMDAVDG